MDIKKLIRDKIPEHITKDGKIPRIIKATEGQFAQALRDKLVEEVHEYLENNDPQELVDIFEVLLALCDRHSISYAMLEKMRKIKAKKNGEFKKRLILMSVTDKNDFNNINK